MIMRRYLWTEDWVNDCIYYFYELLGRLKDSFHIRCQGFPCVRYEIENRGKFERFRAITCWVIVIMQGGCVDENTLTEYSGENVIAL